MSEQSPAFQFYPRDFLSDVKQAAMTPLEAGVYIRLLCHCWIEGSLPNDPPKLARLAGVTPFQIRQIWPALLPCFREGEDGRLVHTRLDKERAKQATFRQRASDGGFAKALKQLTSNPQAAWKQPASTARAPAQPLPNPALLSSSSSSSSSAEREKETDPRDVQWEQFQAAYPGHRREGGFMASQAFCEACDRIGFATLMGRLEARKASEDWRKGMVPSMANYFSRELWLQEPEVLQPVVVGESAEAILARRKGQG